MPNLIFYNCSGADAYVTLNGVGAPTWKIKNSGADVDYFPWSKTTTRDPSQDHGGPGNWGRNNQLRIAWQDIDQPLNFPNIQDPANAIGNVDLLLWIFSDRVVFSQQALWLGAQTGS